MSSKSPDLHTSFWIVYSFCTLCFIQLIRYPKPSHQLPRSCLGLNNNFTIYVFLRLATLPWTCDDIHRQRAFVLKILSLSFTHFCLILLLFTFLSFCSPSKWPGWRDYMHFFFLFLLQKMLRKCEVCYSLKLV